MFAVRAGFMLPDLTEAQQRDMVAKKRFKVS
jgi:hypothetical protein